MSRRRSGSRGGRLAVLVLAAVALTAALAAAAVSHVDPVVVPSIPPSVRAADITRSIAAGEKGSAPNCQTATLNTSDVLAHTGLEVSPLPGSVDAGPATQISLLGARAADIHGLSVTGAQSGVHVGRLAGYSQGDGASFVPTEPFIEGEGVTVAGTVTEFGREIPFSYAFTVAEEDPLPSPPVGSQPVGSADDVQQFRSRPDIAPPAVTIVTDESGSAPGDLFTAPYAGPGQDGPMIFNGAGQLVWFKAVPTQDEATNLQVQTDDGRPVLTWWQGYIPPQGFGEGEQVIDNTRYQTVQVVHAGNGYTMDLHDFRILAGNEAVFTVFDPIRCDLSSAGGPANAAVTDTMFQMVDLRTGLVMREWHALDHVALSDSVASDHSSSAAWPFDYFHLNSISFQADGRIVVSSRNTSAYYVLDPRTLEVLDEVGGVHSAVDMGSGTSTNYQHDVQAGSDGTITLFDNGGTPTVEPESRAVVEHLDLTSHQVTEITQYTHADSPLVSGSQGNFQPLANGDALIGWGSEPYLTEFAPSGATTFEARLPPDTQSYRAYRFVWNAQPSTPPALAVVPVHGHRVTVYASWNGATTVARWRVLAGADPQHLAIIATAADGGFETSISADSAGPYFAVQAVGATGQVLGTSRATTN